MSHPANGNPTEISSALHACVSETRAQIAAMESLRETGDRLFASICRGDTDSLGDILEARTAACMKLSELSSAASPLDRNLDQLAASEHPEIREAAAEMLQMTRQIELLRIQILTAQHECEEALRAALADTARQLRETAGEKKVRFAYKAATAASPRYLDSRK